MISPGRLLLGIGCTLGLLLGGMVFWSGPASASTTPAILEAVEEIPDEPIARPLERPQEIGVIVGNPVETNSTLAGSDAPGGMITGRIGISTKILPDLTSYKIIVQEEVNAAVRRKGAEKPFSYYKTFHPDLSLGTPFFAIYRIPFSQYPYRVTVAAAGMNGSSSYIHVNAQNPRGSEEANLVLTPGTVYTVMLRDQRRNPREGIDVHLLPTGQSFTKRKRHDGKSNNFGTVIFQNVEKGDYILYVGNVNAPTVEPKKVTVYGSGASISNGRPHAQGETVIVPDGMDVDIEVFTRYGMPLPKAELSAVQLEIKRFYQSKGTTDRAGRFKFEHLTYGKYQLTVQTEHHGRRDVKFEIKKGDLPKPVRVTMTR